MKSFLWISVVFFAAFVSVSISAMATWDREFLDPVAFVESITLAEPRATTTVLKSRAQNQSRTLPPDDRRQGFVVGGGLAAFTEKVKGQTKQDILDATLFAQLAADDKYDREKDPVKWYGHYKYILTNVGFTMESFGFQEYKGSGDSVSMDKMVLQVLAAIATQGQSLVLQDVLEALEVLPKSDNRIQLFSLQSASSNSGNFQVYPCEVSETGDVSMAMGSFYFSGQQHRVDFLFFGWDSKDTHIYKGTQKVVLNQKVYSKVRDTIADKLGNRSLDLIAAIDLS